MICFMEDAHAVFSLPHPFYDLDIAKQVNATFSNAMEKVLNLMPEPIYETLALEVTMGNTLNKIMNNYREYGVLLSSIERVYPLETKKLTDALRQAAGGNLEFWDAMEIIIQDDLPEIYDTMDMTKKTDYRKMHKITNAIMDMAFRNDFVGEVAIDAIEARIIVDYDFGNDNFFGPNGLNLD